MIVTQGCLGAERRQRRSEAGARDGRMRRCGAVDSNADSNYPGLGRSLATGYGRPSEVTNEGGSRRTERLELRSEESTWAASGPCGPSLGCQAPTKDDRERPVAPEETAGQPPDDGG